MASISVSDAQVHADLVKLHSDMVLVGQQLASMSGLLAGNLPQIQMLLTNIEVSLSTDLPQIQKLLAKILKALTAPAHVVGDPTSAVEIRQPLPQP